MKYRILVCDDEKDIVNAIEIYLRAEGYEVLKAYDGLQALEVLKKEVVDLLIIDVMMPNLDGISTVLKIRTENNLPVIILSAKSEFEDKVLGLNVGADDYITKPFNAIELLARVKSSLRRFNTLKGNIDAQNSDENIYEVSRVKIDDDKKEVYVDGESVDFTRYEYNLLLFMLQNKNKVLSSDQIYQNVWGEEPINAKKVISVHVCHIREKIEINPKKPDILKSVYGMGYRLED